MSMLLTYEELMSSYDVRICLRATKFALFFLALFCWGSARADGFGAEDENLSPLPPAALKAVQAHAMTTDYQECATGGFVGSAVDLSGKGRKTDWVAKTADGCAWGASSVVIWVLKQEGTSYRVVLYNGGQALTLTDTKSHTLRDLKIVAATAGHYSKSHFKFDGKEYKNFKSREVNLQDPVECRRNPDVCDMK
jgi:hypothetical protein